MVISLPVIYWNTKTVGVMPDDDGDFMSQHSTIYLSTTPSLLNESKSLKGNDLNDDKMKQSSSSSSTSQNKKLDPKINCGIPQDKLYRFYSSFGSFWVPLFIMTFVYLKIFLETKRRLHERAKAAQKLAKTMARNLKKPGDDSDDENACTKCCNKFASRVCCYFCLLAHKKDAEMKCDSPMARRKSKREKKIDQLSINSEEFANNKEIAQSKKDKYLEPSASAINLNEMEKRPMLTDKNNNESKETSQTLLAPKKMAESSFIKPLEDASSSRKPLSDGKTELNKSKKIKFNKQTSPVNTREEENLMLNKPIISETSTWRRDNATTSGLNLLQRQKISLTRERKAARTLGIIMGEYMRKK